MTIALIRPESIQMAEAKPFKIELPDAERGRDQRDLDRLNVLNARLAKPAKPRGRMSADDARAADLAERDELERRPIRQAERQWERDAAAETIKLAEARGEEVERAPSGKINIWTRDSLRNLLNAGKLTVDQYETGMKLREAYERRDAGLGSQMDGIGGAGSPTYDNSASVFYGVQTGKALARLSVIEREVAIQCRHEPAALQMLREIVGRGKAVRDFGRTPSVFDRHAKALAMALDVADAVIRGR